jgi:hypothetical protein
VDRYRTPIEKLALTSAATKVAKTFSVKQEGIGEDIPFTLFVWTDDGLAALCQLDPELQTEHPGERLLRTTKAASACRLGFDATAFTFVTEGYCATDPQQVEDDTPLSQQFITIKHVKECITFTHLEAGNTYITAIPYTYQLGRNIQWNEPIHYQTTFPNNQFLTAMTEILTKHYPPPQTNNPLWKEEIAEEVTRWGFNIQWDLNITD